MKPGKTLFDLGCALRLDDGVPVRYPSPAIRKK
jgi:hypothetical protein